MFGQTVILPKNKEVKLKEKIPGQLTTEAEALMRTPIDKIPSKKERHIPQLPRKEQKEVSTEGEKDALKDIVRDKEINENMLDEALDRAQTVIFHCKTVFPFDFFPNDLIVDLVKVTVVNRNFFMSGRMQSVYMRDIVDVEIDTGPFFSSLSVVDMFYAQNKLALRYLRKKDALRAREIILGVVAANKMNVNLTHVEGDNLVERVRELAIAHRVPPP